MMPFLAAATQSAPLFCTTTHFQQHSITATNEAVATQTADSVLGDDALVEALEYFIDESFLDDDDDDAASSSHHHKF